MADWAVRDTIVPHVHASTARTRDICSVHVLVVLVFEARMVKRKDTKSETKHFANAKEDSTHLFFIIYVYISNPTKRVGSSVLNSEVPSTTRILAQIDMRNQIREDQSIGRTDEAFPNINAITSHLLGILQVTTDPILKDYKRWIDIAGKEAIHRTITECIEPEISGLQGKHVSHATLEETRQHQSQTYPHFEGSGGLS